MPSASLGLAPYPGISRLVAFVQRRVRPTDPQSVIRTAIAVCAACVLVRAFAAAPASASRPLAARVAGVAVEPSVRKKQLGLSVEINGHLDAGTVTATGHLLDESGKEERQFTADATCTAADNQTVTFTVPWANPRLWDIDKPNLYTLVLSLKAPGLEEESRTTFGFREFWVDNRRFYLNGTPIRLRPTTGQDISSERPLGFNITIPSDTPSRQRSGEDSDWYTKADQAGWLTIGQLPSVTESGTGRPADAGWSDAQQETWGRQAAAAIRRERNHPSIVMWEHSPGLFESSQDQDPRVLGRVDRSRRVAPSGAYKTGQEACAIIRKLDPTRPVFVPGGDDIGDVYTANMDLNLIPLQEREDWLTEWAKTGDMPFMAVQFGTPYFTSFLRGRTPFDRAVETEPLLTEYAAIYLGRQAYLDETPEYRADYISRFERDQTYRFSASRDETVLLNSPAYQKVEALFNRNTWRSWRTTGLTGGMLATVTAAGPGAATESDKAIVENNGQTLAWITGPWDAPTAKTHSYHVDETVEKQVALINDTRRPMSFRYSWHATINGKPLATGGGKGTLQPAQTLFHPLRFATPFFSAGKADGVIDLTAVIGDTRHVDRFTYRVFPRHGRRDRPPSLPLFDPTGKTGDILPVVDYIPRNWKGERTVPLVLIGQNAFGTGRKLPGNLESYVRSGGRVLIFAQKPEWLEQTVGMRTAAYMSRRVFPVSDAHPIVRGIDALDLRDWRGNSVQLPAKPAYAGPTPEFGWHWGNRGVVSSVAIEKPHMSSWTPLLENEFDLAYSPLMEMDYGKGRVILCTLDFEDHAPTDAAAERVFGRVIDYALHAPLAPKADRVVYVGGKSGAEILNSMGVIYRDGGGEKLDAAMLNAGDAPQLLIVGDDATVEPADLAAYLNRGGRAFFMARTRSGPGAAPKLAEMLRHGSQDVPPWPECRGLSLSDLHWRADVRTPVIESLPDLDASGIHGVPSIGADGLLGHIKLGKGLAVFCQISPERLDADNKTYLRLTRWRQTRTVSQLLSNLGASFKQDGRIFQTAPADASVPGFYYPDYRTDFELGDNPYRYYRWKLAK